MFGPRLDSHKRLVPVTHEICGLGMRLCIQRALATTIWLHITTNVCGQRHGRCESTDQCAASASCSRCLSAIRAYAGSGVLLWAPSERDNPVHFLHVLTNGSCLNSSNAGLLNNALVEMHFQRECADSVHVFPDRCTLSTLKCAQNSSCNSCLHNLYNHSLSAEASLSSFECKETSSLMKQDLADTCRS